MCPGGRGRELANVLGGTVATPLDAQNVVRHFTAIVGRVGLPEKRSPNLRHTSATLPRAKEVPPRLVMETLGHAQIGILMRYSHVIPGAPCEVADIMMRALAAQG